MKNNNLEILYEDNHVIVVFKNENILSQGDSTHDKDLLTKIKEYIKIKYQKPGNVYVGLVHRLDRPVSGVMVYAKTSKAASRLSEQIRTSKFKKQYLAVVNGILEEKKGEFRDYLQKLDLKTGRHHQIRVQFSSRGYPLCGDQRYGIQDKKQIALCCYHLAFYHPTTKEKLIFERMPKDKEIFKEFL